MKSILVFYDFFKPAKNAGGIVASLDNLSELISSNNKIYIFTSAYDLGQKEFLSGITPDCWTAVKPNVSVFYAGKSILFANQVARQLKLIAPHVIYINGLFTKFVFVPLLLLKFSLASPKVVIAPRGMVQKGALQTRPIKKKFYFFWFKLLSLPSSTIWHATDSQEEKDILEIFGKRYVVKLALDTPSLHFPINRAVRKNVNEVRLVYLSLITEKKNLLFLIEALSGTKSIFKITLDVYGPIKDELYWSECMSLARRLPTHIHFTYCGTVNPEHVTNTLQEYHFFVLPSFGENFGHAIYESLISSRPVIISENTPWKEVTLKKGGWTLPLELQSFKACIEEAASMDEDLFLIYCDGARTVAKDYVSQNNFLLQYMNLFNE